MAAAAAVGQLPAQAKQPSAPEPVYTTTTGEAADPGVVRDGHDYYAFLTGGKGGCSGPRTRRDRGPPWGTP